MSNSTVPSTSPDQGSRKATSFLIRMNPSMWIGTAIIVALVAAAILAPQISFYPPAKQNLFDQLSPPGADYLLGADQFGRDIWTRLVYGARYSLLIGSLAVLAAMVIGTFIGMIAGFRGGRIDIILMQVMDVILAFRR